MDELTGRDFFGFSRLGCRPMNGERKSSHLGPVDKEVTRRGNHTGGQCDVVMVRQVTRV